MDISIYDPTNPSTNYSPLPNIHVGQYYHFSVYKKKVIFTSDIKLCYSVLTYNISEKILKGKVKCSLTYIHTFVSIKMKTKATKYNLNKVYMEIEDIYRRYQGLL